MITESEKIYILEHAYIPEHIVDLMTAVSGGEPYLIEDLFCCHKEDWLIIVGYPISNGFQSEDLETAFTKIIRQFKSKYVSIMATEIPDSLTGNCQDRESDHYYTLDIRDYIIKARLKKVVDEAHAQLKVKQSKNMGQDHLALMEEFMDRINPSTRVRTLYFKMPEYLDKAEMAYVLEARDKDNRLTGFYVIDLWAKAFTSYVVGCHSKSTFVPGASDLLFHEMLLISLDHGKRYMHLGLGVNKGIIQFKKKWGGKPTLAYEMCELVLEKTTFLDAIRGLQRMKLPGLG